MATDRHSECVILISLRRQQCLRESASMFHRTYTAYTTGLYGAFKVP